MKRVSFPPHSSVEENASARLYASLTEPPSVLKQVLSCLGDTSPLGILQNPCMLFHQPRKIEISTELGIRMCQKKWSATLNLRGLLYLVRGARGEISEQRNTFTSMLLLNLTPYENNIWAPTLCPALQGTGDTAVLKRIQFCLRRANFKTDN